MLWHEVESQSQQNKTKWNVPTEPDAFVNYPETEESPGKCLLLSIFTMIEKKNEDKKKQKRSEPILQRKKQYLH